MAPLSHENAGVLLCHNSFGNHLGEWKNYQMRAGGKNFFQAAQVLDEVW